MKCIICNAEVEASVRILNTCRKYVKKYVGIDA